MMIVLEISLTVLAALLLVPVTLFLVQILLALPPYRPRPLPDTPRPSAAVLIPAHNEALIIADTLRALLLQIVPGDRLLVVADNCSDDTARIAREMGAEVLERHDLVRRGKGYALDFGVCHLRVNPPEVVVVVDADCRLADGALDRLAIECASSGRPIQSLYLMDSPPGSGLQVKVAEFAWAVKNHARALGYARMGSPCPLKGTGMAFPWNVISNAMLASGHLVEDLQLGLELAKAGHPPRFCPEARVSSLFPSNQEGLRSQRTRWEHGHLGMIIADAPNLLAHALVKGNVPLLALVLDLCVPPLAMLVLSVMLMVVAMSTVYMVAGLALPLVLALTAFSLLSMAVLLAWVGYGRSILSLASLVCAPMYALKKVPLYLRFFVRFFVSRQEEWVRSNRDEK